MASWTLAAWLTFGSLVGAIPNQTTDQADALYANRASLANAQQAAALWRERLSRQPNDFDAAWRLGRAGYWLGGHLPTVDARVAAFETGMDAARKAIAAEAARPEGYFWLAANMGGLAELKGLRAGIKYRTPVRQNLEKVLALDPAFQDGSADRALGRWYFKVPGLFGGSNRKSEQHLRKSLTYNPQSIASRYFLAETLEDMGRKADAIRTLQEIDALEVDPDWAPEDAEFKQKARALLAKLMR
jgi:TRAP transporter T-component